MNITCELYIFATLPLSSHFKQTSRRSMATRSIEQTITLRCRAHVSKDNNGQHTREMIRTGTMKAHDENAEQT